MGQRWQPVEHMYFSEKKIAVIVLQRYIARWWFQCLNKNAFGKDKGCVTSGITNILAKKWAHSAQNNTKLCKELLFNLDIR